MNSNVKINSYSIIFLILLMFVYSCQTGIKVSRNSIAGLTKDNDGFILEKIRVSELKDGVPIAFSVDTSVLFTCYEGDCNSSKIYLNKKNSNGYWLFWEPTSFTKYEVFPINFQFNQWYRVRSIELKGIDSEIFLHFNEEGALEFTVIDVAGP